MPGRVESRHMDRQSRPVVQEIVGLAAGCTPTTVRTVRTTAIPGCGRASERSTRGPNPTSSSRAGGNRPLDAESDGITKDSGGLGQDGRRFATGCRSVDGVGLGGDH